MESNQLLNLLYSYPKVKESLDDLMVGLLAEHEIRKEGNSLERVYLKLNELSRELDVDFFERLQTKGLQGNLKNYKITDGIAKLKLHLDILSKIFNEQNINSSYKKELVRMFEETKPDIHVDNVSKQPSLIEKLCQKKKES